MSLDVIYTCMFVSRLVYIHMYNVIEGYIQRQAMRQATVRNSLEQVDKQIAPGPHKGGLQVGYGH